MVDVKISDIKFGTGRNSARAGNSRLQNSYEEHVKQTIITFARVSRTRPPPYITWRKDEEKIEDGENSFYLPAEQFNRLLIITKVSKEHEGAYTCTATSSAGSFVEESKASFLTVRGLSVLE